MKHAFLYTMMLSLTTVVAHAGFFCPTNFTPVNEGDSIETVLKKCGQPASQSTTTVPIEPPQEWTYFVTQNISGTSFYTTTGTLKMTVAFDANGKVVNITVNGIGVGGTGVCNNQYIQLGSTRDQVKANCGIPFNINKQTVGGPQNNVFTTYTYDTNPPKTVTFKNGQIVEQ